MCVISELKLKGEISSRWLYHLSLGAVLNPKAGITYFFFPPFLKPPGCKMQHAIKLYKTGRVLVTALKARSCSGLLHPLPKKLRTVRNMGNSNRKLGGIPFLQCYQIYLHIRFR